MRSIGTLLITGTLVASLSGGLPTPALGASIGDPTPILAGTTKKATHLYTVLGVKDTTTKATVFECTAPGKTAGFTPFRWGVEVYQEGSLQNDVTVGEGVHTARFAGDTDTIGTRFTVALIEDISLGGPVVPVGVARILSESTKLVCMAFLVDPTINPPLFITPLPVIKRTIQKGE